MVAVGRLGRCSLIGALLALAPGTAAAERQVRGFGAVVFGGATTFVDLEDAVGKPHLAIGVGALWLGELLGAEVEAARVPGFFERGVRRLVTRSGVGLLTGSLIVAVPRRLTEYTLRPYLAAGAGWIRIRMDDVGGVFRLRRDRPVLVLGGGATGFITRRVGLNWDMRYIRMAPRRGEAPGLSFGDPRLRFWRGSMGITVRY